MCSLYEILYRCLWNRKFKGKSLKEQNGYVECYDLRQKRYRYNCFDTPNKGFGNDDVFDELAHGKNFITH